MLNLNPPTEKEQRRIDAMIRLQRKQLRTQRMGRMLSMTDRILDRQVIDVVVEKTDAIAYTDGATIRHSTHPRAWRRGWVPTTTNLGTSCTRPAMTAR